MPSTRATLAALIGASHSDEAAQSCLDFKLTPKALDELGTIGFEILQHFPFVPNACTSMSAYWVGLTRDRTALPVHQVVGDLYVYGKPTFLTPPDAPAFSSMFGASATHSWDGHSWLALGDCIGDLSICRTARSLQPSKPLRQAVENQFGPRCGLLLMKADDFDAEGFDYRPRYVLTQQETDVLMVSAKALFPPEDR
jgi:hypothetical protein